MKIIDEVIAKAKAEGKSFDEQVDAVDALRGTKAYNDFINLAALSMLVKDDKKAGR